MRGARYNPRMARVLIADDHPLFRVALRQACTRVVADAEVREATRLDEVFTVLEEDGSVELVLLDLEMPGSRGLSGLAALRARQPTVAVLVVSAHDAPAVVRRVLDHDAAGFISKSASSDAIATAVRKVLAGETWLPPQLARAVAAEPGAADDRDLARRLGSLTPQQFRVLELLAEGLLNKQIADRLEIQPRTVKAHVTAILDKLDVANRTQASNALHRLDLRRPGLPGESFPLR